MNFSDKVADEIFKAVDIIVDQKIRDTSYTQTINCQVQERIKGSSMYQVLYQNETIRATSMGASYNTGDKVIVLMPDKNPLAPKFILGRVNDRTPTIIPNQEGEISQDILREIQKIIGIVTDMSSDSVITTSEKKVLEIQWQSLKKSYDSVIAESIEFGVDPSPMIEAFVTLSGLVEPILEDKLNPTEISGIEFQRLFSEYYTQEQNIRRLILSATKLTYFGAQNLIKNADFRSGNKYWTTSTGFGTVEPIEGLPLKGMLSSITTGNSSGVGFDLKQSVSFFNALKAKEIYTFSLFVKRFSTALNSITIDLEGSNKTYYFTNADPINEWVRVKISFPLKADLVGLEHNIRIYTNLTPGKVYITGLQLERGEIMTDFKVSTQELEDRVDDAEKDIEDLENATTPEALVDTVLTSDGFAGALSDLPSFNDFNELSDIVGQQGQYVSQLEGDLNTRISNVSSSFTEKVNAIEMNFSMSAGVNLIRNSTGFFDDSYWSPSPVGSLQTEGTTEIEQKALGSAFYVNLGTTATQTVVVKPATDYSFSFWLKKAASKSARIEISNPDTGEVLKDFFPPTATAITQFSLMLSSFKTGTSQTRLTISIIADVGAKAYFSGLMLNEGTIALQWSSHSQEIANTNIRFNLNGIRVNDGGGNGYTQITPDEFAGYAYTYDDNNVRALAKIFTLNGDVTEVLKLKAAKSVSIGDAIWIEVKSSSYNGLALFL